MGSKVVGRGGVDGEGDGEMSGESAERMLSGKLLHSMYSSFLPPSLPPAPAAHVPPIERSPQRTPSTRTLNHTKPIHLASLPLSCKEETRGRQF